VLRTRLIPALLVDQDLHLVKTTRFEQRHYLGDPLNAAYVFSGYEVDELLVLDIDATPRGATIPPRFVQALSHFTTVPLTIGGGLHSLSDIHDLLALGVEKVALSSALRPGLAFLEAAANRFGSSTITVVLNLRRGPAGEPLAYFGRPGASHSGQPLHQLARACEQAGAGELVFHDVDREGCRVGYDVPLFADLNQHLSIPLVALGGCGEHAHLHALLSATPLSGVASGSLFAYAPATREVLLNYPATSAWFQSQWPSLLEAWR
jgi:cyclase